MLLLFCRYMDTYQTKLNVVKKKVYDSERLSFNQDPWIDNILKRSILIEVNVESGNKKGGNAEGPVAEDVI